MYIKYICYVFKQNSLQWGVCFMKQRHTTMLLCVATPVCVILRVIQLLFTIDNKTGFMKPQYSAISILISVIVCASIAAISLLSVVDNQKKQTKEGFNAVLSAVSAIAGLAFFYQAIAEIITFDKNRMIGALLVLLSFAAAGVFIAYGIKDIVSFKIPSVVYAVFPIYYIVKLISLFVTTSAIALITQNVFMIFTNCALLLFMHEVSNFENGIEDMSKRPKKLYAYGIIASMLCAATSLPEFVLVVAKKTQPTCDSIAAIILNIFVGIFAITYILCNFNDNDKIKKTVYKHSA